MIKILFLSVFLLGTSASYAVSSEDKSTFNYQGQTFNKKDVCESEAQDVALRMEEIGYHVFDHTCLNSILSEQYVVTVKYEYDVLNTIEKLESKTNSIEKCEAVKSQALIDFSQMSAEVISAYCVALPNTGVALKVDYKKNDDYIRSYSHAVANSDYQECLQNKQHLEQVLTDNQVRPLISFCSEDNLRIQMHYTVKNQRSLKMIRGKKIDRRSGCEVSDQSILSHFDESDLNGLMTFCSKRGGQLFKSVLYIDQFASRVEEFKGFSRGSIAECEISLAKAAEKFVTRGHAPLYQYCQKSRGSYTPVIHYHEKSPL